MVAADADVLAKIREIVAAADIATFSLRQLKEGLKEHFGDELDLDERKAWIKEQLAVVVSANDDNVRRRPQCAREGSRAMVGPRTAEDASRAPAAQRCARITPRARRRLAAPARLGKPPGLASSLVAAAALAQALAVGHGFRRQPGRRCLEVARRAQLAAQAHRRPRVHVGPGRVGGCPRCQ